MAPGGEGSATKGGVWLPGAHVSASDKNLDAWMDNLEVNDSGMLLFHFCAKSVCRAKSANHDVASHITHFRLMPPVMALKIPWAKAGVQAYLDEVAATEIGDLSPTSPATSGAGSDVENAAADAVMPKGRTPALVPKGNVNSANAAWSAAWGSKAIPSSSSRTRTRRLRSLPRSWPPWINRSRRTAWQVASSQVPVSLRSLSSCWPKAGSALS